jgi:hypothetical protein
MIGYKMRFSPVVVCTKVKTFPMEKYKHGWENDMDVGLTTLLLGKVLQRSSFVGTFNHSYKKLGL